MLSSSVRRVVSSATPTGLASALTSSAPRAGAASVPVFSYDIQRRFSSSKPSRPDNKASDLVAGQSVTGSAARSSRKSGTGKRKSKAEAAAERAALLEGFPYVPPTRHISQEALGLSSFFSLHRPISITHTMPRTVSDEQFASIFTPPTPADKVSDTMSTLSSTIGQLEVPMAELTIHGSENQGMGNDMPRVEVRSSEGNESNIYYQVENMSGEFTPFRPPPLPTSASPDTAIATDADADAYAAESEVFVPVHPRNRSYTAAFTIEESTESNGQMRYSVHSARITDVEQSTRTSLNRLLKELVRADVARGLKSMYALSVRRQRKLKMKKKKYKKLMKRTRNLRQSLNRG
ncbi:hypothetical protein E4U58_001354 [Claviceps cyperi]|nr:hypothetical protein E4U58_001354 [Claviceps cyperi]